ncbi:hypothetical protein BKA70DRAFT_1277683 [Coprinopsis sp. MPI-PUGE-AT-0042]|nr:hypothetical protein BKA70DRAFT_1277683 [Coprinopsis sp. MPI-PUGE-AT-0042]
MVHIQPGEAGVGKTRRRSVGRSQRDGYSNTGRAGASQSSAVRERELLSDTIESEEWESEEEEEEVERETRIVSSSVVPSTPRSAARRRRPTKSRAVAMPRSPRGAPAYATSRTITPAQTPPPDEYVVRERRARAPEEDPIPWEEAPRHAVWTLKHAVLYSLDVVRPAIKLMKYPLIVIVFLLLLATVLISVAGVFKSAFAPFCYIPGVNTMGACQWINYIPQAGGHGTSTGKELQRADYPALVDLEAKTFDQLVDDSMGVAGSLSLNLKKTEVACKDLISLVRISDLASKDVLAETLVEFTNDAKVTSEGLNRLSAKFNGALDHIMAVNDHALNRVAQARNSEPKTLGEQLNAMMPWSPPRKDVDLVVLETFEGAMDVLSSQLERLMVVAEASSHDLGKLEETLTTLQDIVQRENGTVVADKDELLQQLWTKLGGNRKGLRSFERHLKLLKELATYKKQAQAHVVAALHTLQGMSQEMEDIRERVAAPDLAAPQIEPEVHMKSIQMGLERLKESRVRARELDRKATNKILGMDGGVPVIGAH